MSTCVSLRRGLLLPAALLLMASSSDISRAQTRAAASSQPSSSSFDQILDYIGTGWDRLTRNMNTCKSLDDPKVKDEPILYLLSLIHI